MPGRAITKFQARNPKQGEQGKDGSRLKKLDPERYSAIIRAIQAGVDQEVIQNIFQIVPDTFKGILQTEKLEADFQGSILEKVKLTRNLALEKLHQALQDGAIKGSQLGVTFGIVSDKYSQIAGEPTTRIRHEHQDLTHNSLVGLVNKTPKKAEVIEAEIVEEKS